MDTASFPLRDLALPRLALLFALVATAASAQPSGADLLADWRTGWDRASAEVDAVEMRETLDRTVDGPRGDIEARTEGRLEYPLDGPPRRDIRRAELDGRRLGAVARQRFENRTRRAFGPAGGLLLRPAPLPGRFLSGARAEGRVTRSTVDGRPAWRVRIRGAGVDADVTAWFTREDTPHLLRLRVEQSLPERARAVFEADYREVDGLDVPTTLRTTVTLRQRRRLRDYVVSLRARGTYRTPEFVRSE